VILIIMGVIVVIDSLLKLVRLMKLPAGQGLSCDNECVLDEKYEMLQD
jgi:hypothetical protein